MSVHYAPSSTPCRRRSMPRKKHSPRRVRRRQRARPLFTTPGLSMVDGCLPCWLSLFRWQEPLPPIVVDYTVPFHCSLHALAHAGVAELITETCGAADRRSVGGNNDVSFLDSALLRRGGARLTPAITAPSTVPPSCVAPTTRTRIFDGNTDPRHA